MGESEGRAVSAAGGLGGPARAPQSWPRQINLNARATIATLLRAPRRSVAWPSIAPLAIGAVVAVVVVIASMSVIDGWSVDQARRLPAALIVAAQRFTDLGKGGWFLWPIGLVLLT